MVKFQQAQFLVSSASVKHLPEDAGVEVAFVGRSNAGKSSALNALTRQKGLAKVSKTPGRTQLINFFEIDQRHRLVDLPGYGFAKVPVAQKKKWETLIDAYLRKRQSLCGLILLMDIRHPLKPIDVTILEWAHACELPVHVLLTKADKLKRGAQMSALNEVKKTLVPDLMTVQCFSSLSKQGLDECEQQIKAWFKAFKDTEAFLQNASQ